MSGPPRPLRMDLAWISAAALLAVGALLALRIEVDNHRLLARQAQVQADLLAASVTAALAFEDAPSIQQYVGALRANPEIASAVVYDLGGRPMAAYVRSGAPPPPPRPPEAAAARASYDPVRIVAPVAEGSTPLGTVYVEMAPEPLTRVLARHSALGLLTLMAMVLLVVASRAARQLRRRAEELTASHARLTDEMAEREKVEEALRQSQKMESLGQLTGGVAHDFNNLLTIILGGLEIIGRRLPAMAAGAETARMQRAHQMAVHGAERAATLTARLLAFSRRQPLQPQALDANKMVQGMSELFQRTLGETVTLQIVLGAGLWRTRADPSQLENALINLSVNARDAMPDGGRLTIETANAALDDAYVQALPEPVTSGQYVMLTVTDTGAGMDAETLEKAFEPFFTTKDVGKGTGLGLSQVYGFVHQSGGHVRIYSEVGHGTSVRIYLPRFMGAAADQEVELAVDPALLVGDETVLVVEDHEELRAYSVGILRELGYRVYEAADGVAALEILGGPGRIDLLFTDVVLPGGMNGRQVADQARIGRPDLKVLFTTGYTRNAIVHNGALDPGVQLITKPFTFNQLALKLRRVLDAD